MLDLALDITRLLGRALKGKLPTGIDRVGLAYVDHYGPHARAMLRVGNAPLVATREASDRLFAQLLDSSATTARGRFQLLEAASRFMPDAAKSPPRLLLHTGHGGLERVDFLRRWASSTGRLLAFVHDLIPLTHPEFSRPGEKEKHAVRMHSVLRHAEAVVVNSEATRVSLEAFAEREGLPLPRTLVAHLGLADLPGPSPVRPLPGPYFVMVGTIEARKNHWFILQLWRRMVEEQGKDAPKLIIVGQRGWECENVFDLLDRCESLRGVVLERPTLRDGELATYVHHAQALLFPSFVEGFGLPLIEALHARIPAVCSTLQVFRELAGDIPLYIDPLDGPGWRARIDELAPLGGALGRELRARSQGFRAPTWAQHFAKVDRLLGSLS